MLKRRPKRTSAPHPYEVLFQMVIGKWISQAIGTVVEIGVPDQLAKGARRCSDIAREADVSEDGLYRLLRALASVGLFAESADRRFKLTPMGELLRTDHPQSAAGYARFTAHDITWRQHAVGIRRMAVEIVLNHGGSDRSGQHSGFCSEFWKRG